MKIKKKLWKYKYINNLFYLIILLFIYYPKFNPLQNNHSKNILIGFFIFNKINVYNLKVSSLFNIWLKSYNALTERQTYRQLVY